LQELVFILIVPLTVLQLTFGLVNVGNISPEIAVGMLLCSCVPGGGLGHLIVLVTGNANTELSVAINFMQIFVPLGKEGYSKVQHVCYSMWYCMMFYEYIVWC